MTTELPKSIEPPELGAASGSAVLFLDIDGVLNRCGKSGQGLESDKVELLAQLITDTGAHVVLSSTWRKYDHLRERAKLMLDSIGATFAGCTPVLERQENGLWRAEPRGHEIRQWLDEHPGVTRFVILDDDHDMRTLTPFLVATDSFTGLTPEIAAEVRRRLNEKWSDRP